MLTEGAGANAKRQSKELRCIRMLSELTNELDKKGFTISRTDLRLLLHRSSSTEGKRHVTTVPEKLLRAQNDAHSKHVDQFFAAATFKRLDEIASF
jgi:hypothetical protein